jgi:hypothetical protein
MEIIYLHGKTIYPEETIFILRGKYFPGEINFDTLSQKKKKIDEISTRNR